VKKEVKDTVGLPLPRLELRWVKKGKTWDERECVYELVMPLRELDIRREDENCKQVRSVQRIEISRTKVSGGKHDHPPIYDGVVDAPFRDGAHAQWDAEALNLSVWATCGDVFSRLYPKLVFAPLPNPEDKSPTK